MVLRYIALFSDNYYPNSAVVPATIWASLAFRLMFSYGSSPEFGNNSICRRLKKYWPTVETTLFLWEYY